MDHHSGMSNLQQGQVTAGRIVVRQHDSFIVLEHKGKTGETVTLRIDPKVLERWAVRQIRQEVFA